MLELSILIDHKDVNKNGFLLNF